MAAPSGTRPVTAIDCHAHVFDARLPLGENSGLVPKPNEMGTGHDFLAVLDAHGISHAVIVGSMSYGTDNRCLLDALDSAEGRLKGVAIVAPGEARQLGALADRGVVGIRFNVSPHGVGIMAAPGVDRLLAEVRELGWFVQINAKNDDYIELLPIIEKSGVRVIVDHCGRPNLGQGPFSAGFDAVLELGRRGLGTVKLSGAYHFSGELHPYRDVDPYIERLVESFGLESCIWGSDWPFVRMTKRIDYGPQLTCLRRWLPDPAQQRMVLVANPVRLFGF